MSKQKVHYTFCRACEGVCGLKVLVENNKIIKIEPDKDHVTTKGHACIKGLNFAEIQYSPDRVLEPMKRTGDKWGKISWNRALKEIGSRLKEQVKKHGPQSAAYMMGSPAGTSIINPTFRTGFFEGIGSKQMYGVGSIDCNNKFRVSEDMYGSPFRVTFPDLINTKFLMILGGNPAVSQMSLVHAPKPLTIMRDIIARGGRVVNINPRKTETAAVGEHHFIRPDTDAYFLASLLREIIKTDSYNIDHISKYMTGFDELKKFAENWTPEKSSEVTGISAEIARELVAAIANADGAALYCSTGVNLGSNGSIAYWIIECINAITGNLDRLGGSLIGKGLFDQPAMVKKTGTFIRGGSNRTGGFPRIVDAFPASLLADEILRESDDRVTSLFVEASNPVLVFPNPGGRLNKAMSRLELLVSIDLFRNETANFAHYILPATTFMERPDLPYAIQSFWGNFPTRYIYYTDPVVKAPASVRDEWWIYARLAKYTGVKLFNSRIAHYFFQINAFLYDIPWMRWISLTPKKIISMILRIAKVGSRKKMLRLYPHGKLLEPNKGGDFLGTDRVLTDDKMVHLAPPEIIAATVKLEKDFKKELSNKNEFKIITRRELRAINSWMHNFNSIRSGSTNHVYINPDDAAELGLTENDLAEISTSHAAIKVPVRVSDEVMKKTIALVHGWGHEKADGLKEAQKNPGINVNLLAGDGPDNIEALSGISHLSGYCVRIRKI